MHGLRNRPAGVLFGWGLLGWGLSGWGLFGLGCSSPTTPAVKAPAHEAATAPAEHVARSPLTADEVVLERGLREHVEELSRKIGERNPDNPWELAAAADYVAGEFEGLGFGVERIGYEVADVTAQNLAVTVMGRERANEVLIIGAHYDSAVGDDSADATGVAALLELARLMRDARSARTVRFVAFALGEKPFAGGADMGSERYAQHQDELEEKIVAMVGLDRIGRFAETRTGELPVQLDASQNADALIQVLTKELVGAPLTVTRDHRLTDLGESTEVASSPAPLLARRQGGVADDWAFSRRGVPSVLISAASPAAGPHSAPAVAESAVDYDAMTRLVMRLRFAIGEVIGERPTNDGMLTPGVSVVR